MCGRTNRRLSTFRPGERQITLGWSGIITALTRTYMDCSLVVVRTDEIPLKPFPSTTNRSPASCSFFLLLQQALSLILTTLPRPDSLPT